MNKNIDDNSQEISDFIYTKVITALKNKENEEHIFKVVHDAVSIGFYKAGCDVAFNDIINGSGDDGN